MSGPEVISKRKTDKDALAFKCDPNGVHHNSFIILTFVLHNYSTGTCCLPSIETAHTVFKQPKNEILT